MRHFIAFATIVVGFCACVSRSDAATIFINEIDYDNVGSDTNEFIEIAGNAGANLNGYVLELVNGATNVVYQTIPLPNYTFPDFTNTGWGFFVLGAPTIAPPPDYVFPSGDFVQNGAPDGIRLLDPGFNVVHYVSYEGTMVGATDVIPPAVQDNNTVHGSISKTGPTSGPHSGQWVFANSPTPGFLNGGQDIIPEPGTLSVALVGACALLRRRRMV
jgi:hypothetical protein